jgi:hypothetical protein
VSAAAPPWTRAVGWIGLASIPVALAVAVTLGPETLLELGPACTFHAATGVVCPMCGSTRALAALSQGHVLDAFRYNPAVLLVFGITIWSSWRLARGQPTKLPVSLPAFLVIVVAVWAANIVSHHALP